MNTTTTYHRLHGPKDGWREYVENVWMLYRNHVIRACVDCDPLNKELYEREALLTVFTPDATATITTQRMVRRCETAKKLAERLVNEQDKGLNNV